MNEIIIKTYLIHVLKENSNHITIYFGLTYEVANNDPFLIYNGHAINFS